MKAERCKMRFGFYLATAVSIAVLLAAAVGTAADWPEKGKVIQLWIASGAGGGSDMAGRTIAKALEQELGTTVVVINKGGGGSQIGATEFMAKAGTDGYDLFGAHTPVTISPYMDPARGATYNLGKDLELVVNYGFSPCAIAVKGDGPYKNLKDFVEAARKNPGKIKGTASGPMVQNDLTMVLLNKVAHIDIARMYFDQQGQQRAALLGGHVDAEMNNDFELIAGQKSGEIRTIAIFDKMESASLPGVPTAESQGYPVYMAATYGLGYKKGTPIEIVEKVEAAVMRASKKPYFAEMFAKIGLPVRIMGRKEFKTYWTGIEEVVAEVVAMAKKK